MIYLEYLFIVLLDRHKFFCVHSKNIPSLGSIGKCYDFSSKEYRQLQIDFSFIIMKNVDDIQRSWFIAVGLLFLAIVQINLVKNIWILFGVLIKHGCQNITF